MIALGRELVRRGHGVTLQTWGRWREDVEREGMRFEPAPEYQVFPGRGRPLKPYVAAVRAARETEPLMDQLAPDAVVADILTLAPALAAEVAGVPVATLIPHVHPAGAPGFPVYSLGARLPRTPVGRMFWRGLERPLRSGLRQGRDELNETRNRLGLAPVDHFHGGISRDLCIVATFPQLEYPRDWPPHTHVVGPLMWEQPADEVELPPGEEPLVLVAPSTSQDREHRLLRAALDGLADLPVRVLATWNRRPPTGAPLPVPANARVVDWVRYSTTMPRCDVVVCHGGHGTVVRALASGCTVVACPAEGDMNENAARIDWAGVGVRLPRRWATPRGVRLAVQRALARPGIRGPTSEFVTWLPAHDPAARAVNLVEELASVNTHR
jgi:UDP:flavonoid glycosyltransferase YjiC (YdhE family)